MNKEITDKERQKITKQNILCRYGLICLAVLWIIITGPLLIEKVAGSLPWFPRHSTISNNLKQWGLIFKMYANDSPGGKFPPLSQCDGLWVPDLKTLYPEYLSDPYIACDPDNMDTEKRLNDITRRDFPDIESVTKLMAQTYVYPGWVVQNDADVEVMKHYRIEKGVHIGDIESKDAHLLWMSDKDAYITDIDAIRARAIAQSTIPVMVARPRPKRTYGDGCISFFNNHFPDKSQPLFVPVLYLDGHVEGIPLEEAPDHIKALLELFPEEIAD